MSLYVPEILIFDFPSNSIQSAFFHPKNKQHVITSSQDCTIRIWDVNSYKKHKDIIKVKNAQGAVKSPVMKCCIDQSGTLIAAVCQDGSLQFFPFVRISSKKNQFLESNVSFRMVLIQNILPGSKMHISLAVKPLVWFLLQMVILCCLEVEMILLKYGIIVILQKDL